MSDKVVEYMVQQQPNRQCRTFHFNEPVPFRGAIDPGVVQYKDSPHHKDEKELLDNPKVVACYETPGVERISAYNKYEFNVVKGYAFTWEQVTEQLLPKLSDLFDAQLVEQKPVEVDLEDDDPPSEFSLTEYVSHRDAGN